MELCVEPESPTLLADFVLASKGGQYMDILFSGINSGFVGKSGDRHLEIVGKPILVQEGPSCI